MLLKAFALGASKMKMPKSALEWDNCDENCHLGR